MFDAELLRGAIGELVDRPTPLKADTSFDEIEFQVYMGIIACLLIALWTGRKPTLRTYEMICLYFTGLADLEELQAHIEKLAPQA